MAQVTTTFNDITSGDIRSHNATFSTARSGSNLATFNPIAQLYSGFTAGEYYIDRDFVRFATGSIPDNATIVSAFIRINGSLGADNNSQSVHIVGSTGADTITTADWANVGTTDFGSKTFASFITGNNDIALNASGLAALSLTGDTKFALRGTADLANSAAGGANFILSTDPIVLSVTYTIPDSGGSEFFINLL